MEPYYCRSETLPSAIGFPSPNRPPRSCDYPYALDPPPSAPHITDRFTAVGGTGKDVEFFPLTFSRRDPDRPNPPSLRLTDREIPNFAASPHATLLSGRRAVAIHTSGSSMDGSAEVEADRLETIDADGRYSDVTARVFVVAASVFESASLLLRSRLADHLVERLG